MSLEKKFLDASEAGNVALVKEYMRQGVDVDYVEDTKEGYNALHLASYSGHADIVSELVAAGGDVNARTAIDGFSPIMLAALSGHFSVVDALLTLAPDVDLTITTPSYAVNEQSGYNVLHVAVLGRSTKVLERLLQVTNSDLHLAQTNDGYSLLHLAAETAAPMPMIQMILDIFPNTFLAENPVTIYANTLLHLSIASMGKFNTVEFFLSKLWAAAPYTHIIDFADSQGFTALHLAVMTRRARVVELLLQAPYHANPNTQSAANHTPEDVDHTPLIEATLLGDTPIAKLLVQHGANLSTADKTGTTALIAAASLGNIELVDTLLFFASSFSSTTTTTTAASDGASSIEFAEDQEQQQPSENQQQQIDRKRLCQQADERGNTALHYAVEGKYALIVEALVAAGADIHQGNHAGHSALYLAHQKSDGAHLTAVLLQQSSSMDLGHKYNVTSGEDSSYSTSQEDADAAAYDVDVDGDPTHTAAGTNNDYAAGDPYNTVDSKHDVGSDYYSSSDGSGYSDFIDEDGYLDVDKLYTDLLNDASAPSSGVNGIDGDLLDCDMECDCCSAIEGREADGIDDWTHLSGRVPGEPPLPTSSSSFTNTPGETNTINSASSSSRFTKKEDKLPGLENRDESDYQGKEWTGSGAAEGINSKITDTGVVGGGKDTGNFNSKNGNEPNSLPPHEIIKRLEMELARKEEALNIALQQQHRAVEGDHGSQLNRRRPGASAMDSAGASSSGTTSHSNSHTSSISSMIFGRRTSTSTGTNINTANITTGTNTSGIALPVLAATIVVILFFFFFQRRLRRSQQ